MVERVAGFDWDEGNQGKCTRHGVSIEEIESIFQDEVWVFPDVAHSGRETRFLGIGRATASDGFDRSVRGTCMPKRSDTTKRKLPVVRTDRQAESFVGRADLTRFDLGGLRPVRFEFAPKSARLNMRLPEDLLAAVKDAAASSGVPYQRYIRQLLERALEESKQHAA